jgi:hypothetical protein
MTGHIASLLLSLVACFMLLCRVDKMVKGITQTSVFIQHAILALAMFCSAVLTFTEFHDWSPAIMAAGIVSFFFLSVHRWRYQAPDGTTKPAPLDESNMRHVAGGKIDRG